MLAIATARHLTGREKVMVMNGAYHGGVLAFGNGGIPINAPYDFVLGKFNQIEYTRNLIRRHATSLACILVEPMLGATGCLPSDPDFLLMLRSESRDAGVILVFDEVMTSRLSLGGVQETSGVVPDMTTLGKYICGGMSFGAFGGSEQIMAMYDPELPDAVPHAGTFNNNTLSMAAGVAAMEELFTSESVLAHNARGDALRKRLNALADEYNAPVHFTGTGSLMNLHGCRSMVRVPEELVNSSEQVKELIFLDLIESGFYIARRGFIALMLPLEDEDLEAFAITFKEILARRANVWD